MQKLFLFAVLIILIVFLICLFSINMNNVKSKEFTNMSNVKSKILIKPCYAGGGES